MFLLLLLCKVVHCLNHRADNLVLSLLYGLRQPLQPSSLSQYWGRWKLHSDSREEFLHGDTNKGVVSSLNAIIVQFTVLKEGFKKGRA